MRSGNERGNAQAGDESHEGQLLRYMRGWVAEGESLKIRERSRRGARRKVSAGRLLGSAPRPRYGFAYDASRTGYVVDPETMPVVVRIFEMLAAGHAINVVARALDEDGVPTPRGGAAWSRRTIREAALDDCYRPHSFSELDGKVPPDVLAGLDPAGVYSVAWSGRVRVRKVSNSRRERETLDPSEWIGVPVRLDGSGPDRRTVDAARRLMEGNTRPRKVGDRFFPLAHGPLRCAHCGCRMQGFGRRGAKNPSYAYRCNSPSRKGTTCPNRHQHHADTLDWAAVDMFEEFASSARLIGLYEAAVAEQDRRLGGRGGRGTAERREALAGRLREAEDERLGYLRQDARGLLSDAELEALLSEVGGRRDAIAEELQFAEDSAERERERKAVREALSSSYRPVHGEWYEDPDAVHPDQFLSLVVGPEKVRRTFLETGARFSVDRHGTLTLTLDPLQTGGTHTATSCESSTRTV